MGHFVNQHSFVLVGIVVLGITALVLRRRRRIALAVALVVLVVAAVWLRTGPGDVRTGTELDAALAKGKPVALEFYSNF